MLRTIFHLALGMGPGGLEHVVSSIARRCDRSQFEHKILVLKICDPDYERWLQAEGIEVIKLQPSPVWRPKRLRELRRLVRDHAPDVIHAHSGAFLDAYATALLAPKSPRLILTSHGYPIESGFSAALRVGLPAARADVHVCVSGDLEAYFRSRYRWIPGRPDLLTIPNGIDTETFQPRPKPRFLPGVRADVMDDLRSSFVIGCIGRLEPVKNHGFLLRAFAALVEKSDQPCRLILIGDGSLRSRLEQMTAELGIQQWVEFWGTRTDISQVLNVLDVFALTSVSEGTSISLLEAQASGVPACVTEVGGNGRIVVDRNTGFLCPLDDPLVMAEHLLLLLQEPGVRMEMSGLARENVRRCFSLEGMVRQYEALYRSSQPGLNLL